MDLRILGSLEVAGLDGVAALGPPKQRALLAVLALHVGEIVSVDRLIDALWPSDPPRTAAHSIQIYVSDLRKALTRVGGDPIVTRAPGYVLQAPPDSVDAGRFERLANDGVRLLQAGDHSGGTAQLRTSLALWRGPALSDFALEEFAQPYIRQLTDRHVDAVEELAAAELAAGRGREAMALAETAIQADPLRERSREILLRALAHAGRHAEALRAYQHYRQQLDDELDVEPSPALQRLQERILLHDTTLEPSDTVSPAGSVQNPYKGLRSFTEEDAADFFGRDELVGDLLAALAAGRRLVALVGPSGSGKSSVLAAGLVARLREGEIPGSGSWELVQAVASAGALPMLEAALHASGSNRRVIVLDQFEDLFVIPDQAARRGFLEALVAGVRDPHSRNAVVLGLRADAYDRPLLDSEFAAVFVPAVMNVIPMTTDELRAAITGPAERADLVVEPALLAALVADAVTQPGALPLLQFALTELCERRKGATLSLADYRALGGLHGILTRGAEGLYLDLDEPSRDVAMQVFLRLVRPGPNGLDVRRPAALSELADLDVDPVELSQVLDRFGRRRFLTFDRDAVTGRAVVEVAHESLLREWERLADWLQRHREALRRHAALSAAAEEWEAAGRDVDYLVSGLRLTELETSVRPGALQLTGRERAFLEACLDRRRAALDEERARTAASRRLERRARTSLLGLAVALVALAALAGFAVVGATGDRHPPVALLYNGDGLFSASLMVQDGFDRGVTDFGLTSRKSSVTDGLSADQTLLGLSRAGSALVVAGAVDTNVDSVAKDFPGILYAVIDLPAAQPNVIHLAFADNQSSFLAGVAAALTTRTGVVGFIGGTDSPTIWPFEAGFEAGVRASDPSVRVVADYLAPAGDYNGYADPGTAATVAAAQYRGGADVIFAAAGDSGLGVFSAAAKQSTAMGHQLWAIGVDSDQYVTVGDNPANMDWRAWQPHILTSVLKRMDSAVYDLLADYAHDALKPGTRVLGLAAHGVDLATSGGYIDALAPALDAWRAKIVAGSVAVPCIPEGREAQALGVQLPGCG